MTAAATTTEPDVRSGTVKRKQRLLYILRRVAVFVAVLYTAWLLVAVVMQDYILFPGSRMSLGPNEARLVDDPAWEEWAIPRDSGGPGVAYFLPSPEAGRAPAPAVVFFHGNGDLAEWRADVGHRYATLGVHTLIVEYPGYGASPGRPSQKGIVADALAAIGMLESREEVDAGRIVYHGHSIGGGVAAQCAAANPPAVLVLESTFISMAAMAHRYLIPSFFLRHDFRTDKVLETLDRPVLILHGAVDPIILPRHARVNDATADDSELYIFPSRLHTDLPAYGDYMPRLRGFLERRGIIEPTGEPG